MANDRREEVPYVTQDEFDRELCTDVTRYMIAHSGSKDHSNNKTIPDLIADFEANDNNGVLVDEHIVEQAIVNYVAWLAE